MGFKRKRRLVTKRDRESGSVLIDRLSYLAFFFFLLYMSFLIMHLV